MKSSLRKNSPGCINESSYSDMNVLLLQPLTSQKKLWGKYAVEGGLIPPIGLLSIASYLESKGHKIKIIDPIPNSYDKKRLKNFLKKNHFDLIGIPAFTNTVADTYRTVNFCKKISPKTKVVVGGVHATILPVQTMKECLKIDFLVIGEGERVLEQLLKYLKSGRPALKNIKGLAFRNNTNKIIVNPRKAFIKNINTLPLPAYHLLDMSKYTPHPTQYKVLPSFPVIAQRGCPFNCAFCSAHIVHGRVVRYKSVDNLIKEIKLLIDKYGAKGIHFQDSTFTINKKYIADFCKEIIKRNLKFKWDINTRVDCLDEKLVSLMKKAGLWMINFGLESGNQSSLDLLNKGITLSQIRRTIKMVRRYGIVTFSTWILGIPGEDEKMVKETIRFAKEIATELVLFFLPVPYPGTDLIDICRKDGGLIEDAKWEDYSSVDFSNPVYVNPLLGKEKMLKLLKYAYLSYYLSPKILWRNLKCISSWQDLIRYWRGFRAWFYGFF